MYLKAISLKRGHEFGRDLWEAFEIVEGIKGKEELMQLLYSQKIKEIINPLK